MTDPIWQELELVQDFMPVLVTSKFGEDPIKYAQASLGTPSSHYMSMGNFSDTESEVVETVSRRRVDLCCLQETRWKMEGVKQIVGKDSRFKLFWSGNDKGTGGVGSSSGRRMVGEGI